VGSVLTELRGVCPFLGRKCKSCRKGGTWICEALDPRKRVDKENCVDFGDCMVYQAKMVEVNKLL